MKWCKQWDWLKKKGEEFKNVEIQNSVRKQVFAQFWWGRAVACLRDVLFDL